MKSIELYDQYKNGLRPTVKFKKGIEEQESFDPGMKAKLINMYPEEDWGYCCIFDFTEYEDFNKTIEMPVWYGSDNEMLKWSESKYYPKDKRVKVYIGNDDVELFDIVEESLAYRDYKNSGSTKTYTEWLEEQYLVLKGLA
jgi:hypothetical protein